MILLFICSRTNISLEFRKAIAVGLFNPSYMGSILILVSLPYISPSSLEKATLICDGKVQAEMMLLPVSATYTLPEEESTAIPAGDLIGRFPVPYSPCFVVSPHFVTKVPLVENTCILLLPVSATYTLPSRSTAIPAGDLILPSAVL